MIQCTHCGRFFDRTQNECPSCFKPLTESAQHLDDESARSSLDVPTARSPQAGLEAEEFNGPMAPIARFTNAAEAGFFAHELTYGEGIPCAVTMEENFDALSGYWSAKFVLSVPEDEADAAADELKRLLEQTAVDEWDVDGGEPSRVSGRIADGPTSPALGSVIPNEAMAPTEVPLDDSGVNWVPIVLTLAAGSAVFWGVRRLQDQPKVEVPHRPNGFHHEDLWDHIETPSAPWVQKMENGQGQRKLWVAPKGNVAILREDADGDGLFETEVRIPRTALER